MSANADEWEARFVALLSWLIDQEKLAESDLKWTETTDAYDAEDQRQRMVYHHRGRRRCGPR